MATYSDALAGIQSIYIDTAPLIYYVEANPDYVDLMDAILTWLEQHHQQVVLSTLTLTETLVKPMQANDADLQTAYRDLILNTHHVTTYPINVTIAERAAMLRANYKLRTPDAIHLATAILHGCDAFLTNDHKLKRVAEITVLVLDDLELS